MADPVAAASGFDWSTLIAPILGAISGIASGGWGGLVAMAGTLVAGVAGVMFLIRYLNKGIDNRDMDNSGQHVGSDAADIAGQARTNQQILDGLQKNDPPK